jgi:hypothetical protein
MPTTTEASEFKDKIVLIDLENGMQLTARIKDVVDEHIICEDILLFQITVTTPNPNLPPGPGNEPQQKIQSARLGGPFRHPDSPTPPIPLLRVLFIHLPIDAIEKAYMQATTGIAIAGADTLGRLGGIQRS